MIKGYVTAADVAGKLRISVKTLNGWIARWSSAGTIDPPPTFQDGLREVRYFPPDYIEKLESLRKSHSVRVGALETKSPSLSRVSDVSQSKETAE